MTSRRPTAVFGTAYPSQTALMPVATRPRAWRRTRSVNVLRNVGTRDAGGDPGTAYALPGYLPSPTDQAASSPGVPALTPGIPVPDPNDCGCG